jgi:hypothetical protein
MFPLSNLAVVGTFFYEEDEVTYYFHDGTNLTVPNVFLISPKINGIPSMLQLLYRSNDSKAYDEKFVPRKHWTKYLAQIDPLHIVREMNDPTAVEQRQEKLVLLNQIQMKLPTNNLKPMLSEKQFPIRQLKKSQDGKKNFVFFFFHFHFNEFCLINLVFKFKMKNVSTFFFLFQNFEIRSQLD